MGRTDGSDSYTKIRKVLDKVCKKKKREMIRIKQENKRNNTNLDNNTLEEINKEMQW